MSVSTTCEAGGFRGFGGIWGGGGVKGTTMACNNGLSFFINIPDNARPRLEPENTLAQKYITEVRG